MDVVINRRIRQRQIPKFVASMTLNQRVLGSIPGTPTKSQIIGIVILSGRMAFKNAALVLDLRTLCLNNCLNNLARPSARGFR